MAIHLMAIHLMAIHLMAIHLMAIHLMDIHLMLYFPECTDCDSYKLQDILDEKADDFLSLLLQGTNQVLPSRGNTGQGQMLPSMGVQHDMLQHNRKTYPTQIQDNTVPSPTCNNAQTYDSDYLDLDSCFYGDIGCMAIPSSPTSLPDSCHSPVSSLSMDESTMISVGGRHSSISSVDSLSDSTHCAFNDCQHTPTNPVNGYYAKNPNDAEESANKDSRGAVDVIDTDYTENNGDIFATWEPHGKDCDDNKRCQFKCLGWSNYFFFNRKRHF